MFLLVSVRHVGAHPDELQHGVSIQSSINLGKTFLRISRIRIIPYFEWRDTDSGESRPSGKVGGGGGGGGGAVWKKNLSDRMF